MAASTLDRFYALNDGLFTFNVEYLFFVGLWPKEEFTRNQKILYKLYEAILHLLTVAFILLGGIGTYLKRDDTMIVLSNLDKSLAVYNFFLNSIIFVLKRGQLKSLIDEIENSGDEITEERKKLMVTCAICITLSSTTVILAFSLVALFNREMSVEVWLPFDPLESLSNLITAVNIVAICVFPSFFKAFSLRSLVFSMIMYLCDQLIHLQNDIRNLEYSKDTEKVMRMKFKGIIKKHIRIMRYSMKMERIFKEYFLIQNLAVTVEFCMNAVMITVVGVQDLTLLISFLAYLTIALTNAYIYCYLGNKLITQSEGIALAAYESTWTSWPLDLQKDLLILMSASQRPLKLTAGGLTVLSLQTFSETVYNGYSFFTVLNDAVN